ncbi:MAG: hypothetical protein HYZ00_10920, partial [Candidatus Hydrogenedentes bacterium]|nr:hypothetical protein [Candidatus Hydrogenedentota bacterium]
MFSGIRCVVFSVLMGITPAALAWQPTGSLEELYDASLLPRLRPGVVARSFSSYDRTGGNNDGFSGQYSKLREEDGNSVIAEMEGPGCIQRIWFTHSVHKEDGLLERKHEHIKIYLDGKDTPALDVPLENLFDGSLEHFPHPLAGQGIGGFYSYVPIPYLKSCKVVIDGLGVRFYQLNYVTFPSAEGVRPFSMELTDAESAALTEAVKRWSDPLAYTQAHKQLTMQLKVEYEPGGRRNMKYSAHPEGEYSRPLLINGITLSNLTPDEVRQGVLVIDFDKPEGYALRVPMELYFGQAFQPESFAGLFFGRQSDVYYNIVPFVVPNDCTFSVEGPAAFKPLLTIFMSIIDETT